LIILVEYEKYDCCRRRLLLVLDVPVIITLLGRSVAPELSFRVVRRDVAHPLHAPHLAGAGVAGIRPLGGTYRRESKIFRRPRRDACVPGLPWLA
jgi:hypothetical protein